MANPKIVNKDLKKKTVIRKGEIKEAKSCKCPGRTRSCVKSTDNVIYNCNCCDACAEKCSY